MLKPIRTAANPEPNPNESRKLAVIDVGSNSFRLIVMTYIPGSCFQMTDEVRETVRLVHGLGQTGNLAEAQMERALEVMRLYRAFCDSQGITDIVAVATSATREAANQRDFLERIEATSGIQVRVLSGPEEAYYGYLAAVNSTTISDGFAIDLGGGSLEISYIEKRLPLEMISLTLGAVRTTEEWLPQAPASAEAVTRLRRHLKEQLAPLTWFRAKAGMQLVAQGGSLRNLARVAQKAADYPLDELHGYVLSLEDVQRIIRILQPLAVEARRSLPGMKGDRADIALAAAMVIEACMKHAGFEELMVCSQGVREGLFYERYLSTQEPPPLVADVRRASVLNMAHLYHFQEQHAGHVEHLALSMFDQLRGDPHCGQAEREILWAAAMLHDIGMQIDYNDHHRHSYYLILNSGLPGWTHRELVLIALAAKYHRKGEPDPAELEAIFEDGDMKRLRKMTALLRLAEQLDRSRDGSVREVRLISEGDSARLEVHSEVDVTVALWSARQHAGFFEAAFGKTLEIEHVRETYGN